MDRVHVIRHQRFVEKRSIRRIARELGLSRNTVRKYLAQAEPVRRAGKPRGRPVFERVERRIEELLEDWKQRTTEKQRITATRLHAQLIEEGYEVGQTLVRAFFRERRRQRAEVYVPLVHRPGDEAQVDFFDVTVEIGGEQRKAWLFVMRLMYSGRDFVWLYEWADQVSFLDGHVRAFEHLGAVPHRIVYDNLSSAVRRMMFPERELTARFTALVSHYLFEPCFARPATGHDKGGVEARGKGVRLRHLVPIPRGQSLREIAGKLLGRIDRQANEQRDEQGKTAQERFEQERVVMLPVLGTGFDPAKVELTTVSRSALVRLGGATYSVPSRWQSLDVTAYIGADAVRIVCGKETVRYERQGFGRKLIRYEHYLSELAKKPQAVRQVIVELLAELGEPYGNLWRLLVDVHGPREAARVFARVLGAVVDHGRDRVAKAVESALLSNRTDLLALAALVSVPKAPKVAVPASLAVYDVETARLADYDALLVGEEP